MLSACFLSSIGVILSYSKLLCKKPLWLMSARKKVLLMQSDISVLQREGKRLALDAEQFLQSQEISPSLLRRLISSPSVIITLEEIRSAIAESSKLPDIEPIHKGHAAKNHIGDKSQIQDEIKKEEQAQNSPQSPSSLPQTPAAGLVQESQEQPNAVVFRPTSFKPIAKEYAPKIKIYDHTDVSGQSRCVGMVDDFVAYFRDRFERESAILRSHQSNLPIINSSQLSQHVGEDVRIIAMVSERRMTHSGNLYLELEDEYGQLKAVFSNREREFAQKANSIIRDDVIAVDGRVGQNFFAIHDVTWPDLPLLRQQKSSEADLAVAYLSDTHVGSKLFLEKAFKRFIRWLWGEEGRQELAGKVKYVIIAGDIADGIGVYPGQEKELAISDIFEQYAAFDKLMEAMPDWVEVIVCPGNHDAVRRGEPQPILPIELVKSDIKKIGSPAMVDIEGFRHLVYHGTSLDSVIANIPGLSYVRPEGAMMELLRRRHLSPIYGENLIVPERRDYMLIEEEPDVVHMGHLHKNAAMKYRGTIIINSGTFQERTDFQVRMGHVPTPAIVPVLELKEQKLSQLKFMEESL